MAETTETKCSRLHNEGPNTQYKNLGRTEYFNPNSKIRSQCKYHILQVKGTQIPKILICNSIGQQKVWHPQLR
jgi:hypothetical protein